MLVVPSRSAWKDSRQRSRHSRPFLTSSFISFLFSPLVAILFRTSADSPLSIRFILLMAFALSARSFFLRACFSFSQSLNQQLLLPQRYGSRNLRLGRSPRVSKSTSARLPGWAFCHSKALLIIVMALRLYFSNARTSGWCISNTTGRVSRRNSQKSCAGTPSIRVFAISV